MLSVASVQIAHPLVTSLPPEVEETVGDGVVLKHNVVHVSIFLKRKISPFQQKKVKVRIETQHCPSGSSHLLARVGTGELVSAQQIDTFRVHLYVM